MIIRLLRYTLVMTLVVSAIPCRAVPDAQANPSAERASVRA